MNSCKYSKKLYLFWPYTPITETSIIKDFICIKNDYCDNHPNCERKINGQWYNKEEIKKRILNGEKECSYERTFNYDDFTEDEFFCLNNGNCENYPKCKRKGEGWKKINKLKL